MVNYCQNEGVNSFFVVEAEMDSVNSYEIDMLYNNFVGGIIQPEFRSIDGRMLLYNKINGMKSLKDYMLANSLTAKQTLSIMGAACNAVVEAEEYMLDPDNLMLKPEYIFCSVGLEECRFVYAPGAHMNVKKQVRHLAEEIIRRIDHSDGKLVDFMYGVYETVVMDNFDMEKLREDVCEMQKQQSLGRGKAGAAGKRGDDRRNCDEHGDLKDMLFGGEAVPMSSAVPSGEPGKEKKKLFWRRKNSGCRSQVGGKNLSARRAMPGSGDQSGRRGMSGRKNLADLRSRWLLILFIITIAAGLGLAVFQSTVYGHIADVRLLMLAVAVAAVELFLYLEFRRKDDGTMAQSAVAPAGAPAGIAVGVSDEHGSMLGEPTGASAGLPGGSAGASTDMFACGVSAGMNAGKAGIASGVYNEHVGTFGEPIGTSAGLPGEPARMSGVPPELKMVRCQPWNLDMAEERSYICERQNTEKYMHRTADKNPVKAPENLCERTQVLREPDNDTTLLAADAHDEDHTSHISVELTDRQNGEKLEIHMTGNEQAVGRDVTADVVINDRSISRRHAAISEKNGRIYVKDLDSTNGTYVNEICLCKDRYWPLSGGDVLRIGGVEYTVQILLI